MSPPMFPSRFSGLQAPSVKMIHVSNMGLPAIMGGALNTLFRKTSKFPFSESSRRFRPPLSTQNRLRFLTAELAVLPKVYPSKKTMRPLSLSASFGSSHPSARMSLKFATSSSLRSSVCPIVMSNCSEFPRSISSPNILNFLLKGWNFFPSLA